MKNRYTIFDVSKMKYVLTCTSIILLVVVSFSVIKSQPPDDAIKTKYAFSVVNNLNVRTKPDINAKAIHQLNTGDIVEILSCSKKKDRPKKEICYWWFEDYWYKIKINKIEGYVFGFYIAPFEPGRRIIISSNVGIIYFLNDKNKIIKKMDFISTTVLLSRNESCGSEACIAYSAKLADNGYLFIYKEAGWFESEWVVVELKIYDNNGNLIFIEEGWPEVYYSAKSMNFIIIEAAPGSSTFEIVYSKSYIIINNKGEILKKERLDMSRKFTNSSEIWQDEFKREFVFNYKNGLVLWANNTKLAIIDVDNLQCRMVDIVFSKEITDDLYLLDLESLENNDNIITLKFHYWKKNPTNNTDTDYQYRGYQDLILHYDPIKNIFF